jgi:hypothetical protein
MEARLTNRLRRLFIVASVAAAAAACAREADHAAQPAPLGTGEPAPPVSGVPANEYSYAFATPDCAPWDGPAVVLYLLDSKSDAVPPVTRHVRVAIWKSLTELPRHTFRWPASPQPGAAARCSSGDSCEDVTEGQVAFGAVDPDKSLAGEVDLRFANGDRVRKAFKASWQPRRIGCG